MRKLSFFLSCAAFLAACGGDPTQQFVGTYAVSGSDTFSGAVTGTATVNETLQITKSATADKIVFVDSNCNVTALVSGNSFTVDQLTCPTEQINTSGCGICNITISYTSGTGTLVGTALSVSGAGNYTVDTCASCTGSGSGTFTESFTGSKS